MSVKIPTEIYSRVVGYYRPVQQWNKGKQEEFEMRKEVPIEGLDCNGGCTIQLIHSPDQKVYEEAV